MKYSFPTITHIDQVLEAIKDKPEFIHIKKDGYQVVNYVLATENTFPAVNVTGGSKKMREQRSRENAILRECRGITFDMEGNIISRKLHKFFNVSERSETMFNNIDFSQSHVVLEKLDGSMITGQLVNDNLRFCTKMGITDVSMQAEVYVAKYPTYADFTRAMLHLGWVPIYEWCSNKQRIVIDHPEDKLILLHIRVMDTGEYLAHDIVETMAESYDIPVVQAFDSITGDALQYMQQIQNREDIEGVVVQFDDGHMVKIKSSWYVRLHKVKDKISSERKILDLILNNGLDDIKPIMDKYDYDLVIKYEKDFREAVQATVNGLKFELNLMTRHSRKDFALKYMKQYNGMFVALMFKLWDQYDDAEAYNLVLASISRSLHNNHKFEEMKEAFFPWLKYDLAMGDE